MCACACACACTYACACACARTCSCACACACAWACGCTCTCECDFEKEISSHKPYVRFPCESFCILNKSEVTNLVVCFACDLTLQTLCLCFVWFMKYFAHIQTLCSFSANFLQGFAYKLEVTNPMFIFTVISVAFRLQIWGYKPYVRVSSDFWSISHTTPQLQTLCSLSTVLT